MFSGRSNKDNTEGEEEQQNQDGIKDDKMSDSIKLKPKILENRVDSDFQIRELNLV